MSFFNRLLKFKASKRSFSYFLLLILPVICFLLFKFSVGQYYLYSIDPEYAYLFNGLHVARLNFYLGHIDHPGSPLQYLIAINIWVIQLFKMDKSMVANVVSDPELYLKSAHYSVIIINCAAIFIFGMVVNKTHGVIVAVLMQFLPLCAMQSIFPKERLYPETFQMTTVVIFVSVALMYLYCHKFKFSKSKYTLFFAIVVGFGVALKMVFAPLFIVPLFLLKGTKEKLKYFLYFVLSFFIFAIPVLNRGEKFYKWIVDIFTHKGYYGGGNEGFADISTITVNLRKLYNLNTGLFIVQLFAIGLFVFFIFNRKKLNDINRKMVKLLIGILVMLTLIILSISKHFVARYFIPINSIFYFQIFLMVSILADVFLKRFKEHLVIVSLAVVSFFVSINVYSSYNNSVNSTKSLIKKCLITENKLEEVRNGEPFFVYQTFYGDPCIETALNFGLIWAGRQGKHFVSDLQSKYPNSYVFDKYYNRFSFWSRPIDTLKLRSRIDEGALVFIGKDKQEVRDFTFETIHKIYDTPFDVDTVFRNMELNEAIYKLNFLK